MVRNFLSIPQHNLNGGSPIARIILDNSFFSRKDHIAKSRALFSG
jgi:hypothetical protein